MHSKYAPPNSDFWPLARLKIEHRAQQLREVSGFLGVGGIDADIRDFRKHIGISMRYSISIENPPIPTKQEQIIVPQNSMLVLVQAG